MKKTILFLRVLVPCVLTLAPVPSQAQAIRVSLQAQGLSDREFIRVREAAARVEEVFNDPEFAERILAFGRETGVEFQENLGLNNVEILEQIRSGIELCGDGERHQVDFSIQGYLSLNPWSRVPGLVKSDDCRVWLNRKYLRDPQWRVADIAGTLAHEWMHLLGFTHSFRDSSLRSLSVPYAIGDLVTQRVVERISMQIGDPREKADRP